jgi:hypothetical protein
MKYLALTICLFLVACGGGGSKKVIQKPGPPPPPIDNNGEFLSVKPLLDQHCALSGCHSGEAFVEVEVKFLNSRSKIRIGNDTMPPKYSPIFSSWTRREKDIFLSYFDER